MVGDMFQRSVQWSVQLSNGWFNGSHGRSNGRSNGRMAGRHFWSNISVVGPIFQSSAQWSNGRFNGPMLGSMGQWLVKDCIAPCQPKIDKFVISEFSSTFVGMYVCMYVCMYVRMYVCKSSSPSLITIECNECVCLLCVLKQLSVIHRRVAVYSKGL